jgi:hypothetical protein
MQQAEYIGYHSIGDLTSSGTATAITTARVVATGGLDISADIALALSAFQFVGDLFNQWTSRPASDARDFIKNAKPKIAILDPYKRLVNVIAYSQKINPKAIDVNATEWLLWYKATYAEDYKKLDANAKLYWNKYLNTIKSSYNNPNNMNRNLDLAMFTQSELNYNSSPLQSLTNLFSSGTGGKTNWVLYGAIGIGAILLIKYIRK